MRRWIGAVIRFIVSAIVLLALGFILPGFQVIGFTNALLAAIVIAALGYVVELFLGENVSPQNRGVVGFIAAAVVIFATQFFVPGMSVNVLGAILSAIAIGIVDAFVPTELR